MASPATERLVWTPLYYLRYGALSNDALVGSLKANEFCIDKGSQWLDARVRGSKGLSVNPAA